MEEIIKLNSENASVEIVEDNTSREAFSELNENFIGNNENIDTSNDVEGVADELEIDNVIISDEDSADEGEVNKIIGTEANDGIIGTEQDDMIEALGGNDYIVGDPGRNSVGNDTIDGGSGDDNIVGRGGNDSLIGGSGDDDLFGDVDPNVNPDDGAFGNDTLIGGDGKDFLNGGIGDDSLDGGQQNDDLYGGNGDDDLRGSGGEDNLYGGEDNDVLKGSSGNDRGYGEEGNDTLYGGSGNDELYGDRFGQIVGGAAADKLFGDGGNDTLFGGVGSDSLDGGSDDDRLSGVDPFANEDFGGDTIDTLTGGSGRDTYIVGDGDNVFYAEVGDRDYALITDYELGRDSLDVAGSRENYSIGFTSGDLPDGLAIYYEPTADDRELIAILKTDNFFSSSTGTNTVKANVGTDNFASVEQAVSEESFTSADPMLVEDSIDFV